MNVLINAYACSPIQGSEPGIGWHWSVELAKFCHVIVITEGESRREIEAHVKHLPQKDHLEFVFNDVPEKVRKMCENQGDWRFYYYYRQWQKKSLEIARQICSERPIDVIHHLTMQGFREPGLLWKIQGPKFVWGPIGGMENMPLAYLQGASWKQKLFCRLKNGINTLQFRYQPNVRRAFERADAVVASTFHAYKAIQERYREDVVMINDTGCEQTKIVEKVSAPSLFEEGFNIMWVAKFDFRKQLEMALKIIASLNDLDIKLHIVGSGDAERYQTIASQLGISEKCIWHGQVPHDQVNAYMQQADLFLFTSIMEATSTVIMEAIQNQLPIVCFDTCGFGTVVNEKIGIKIPLTNPEQSVQDFGHAIRSLYDDRDRLKELSANCVDACQHFSWERKAIQMVDIYSRL